MIMNKYDDIVKRLVSKINSSQTPVPGFIVGLSGTDSLIAFKIIYEAAFHTGIQKNVFGIHYKSTNRENWFDTDVKPWLMKDCYDSTILSYGLTMGNRDEYRWADLHVMAKKYDCWTVGTINATEKALGKYSILADAVSVQPIQSLWKSEIMALCAEFSVPDEAIRRSRIPDCICGRDEFAAENIELIDFVLTHGAKGFMTGEVAKAFDYIRSEKNLNSFRERIPYRV